ncbi:GNAT family N-acetyltransferase [Janthinobacterium fluminis]|uniref:GNAT family N-acetyltransferase n=1 Tax=Janthinobacterium fluminis TaxID=2987524 RepID=A0ABT5JY06_9BURK|nr:GNAT family N-acetyltransferase [Janthinobacterium fluminis]MDC8756926.1 GNAT family N-acetyltransferase [Janthinobacterium fluminis]
MNIRPSNEDDWEILKTIRLASLLDTPSAFGVSYAALVDNDEAQWRQRASARTQPEFFFAIREGEAVGLIGGGVDSSGQYNLIAMWVHPDYRGSEAAGRLVDAVKARAIAAGHVRVILSVSPDNLRAASFYRRQGFAYLPEWEALASHPEISVQKMEWLATSREQGIRAV